jgi:hypothetical protein
MKKDTKRRLAARAGVSKTAKVLPKTPAEPEALAGSVCAQRVRCGRPNCHCKSGGEALHGPYFYHFWRDHGQLKKRYLRSDQVEATRAACERGKRERQTLAMWCRVFRAGAGPNFAALIREAEAMARSAKHGG